MIRATTAIYNDRENRFRNQIAKIISNRLCWIFTISVTATSASIKSKVVADRMKSFKKFLSLVHEHCISQREVLLCRQTVHFYQISDWYLQKLSLVIPLKRLLTTLPFWRLKVLLQSTELTVQEIADRLVFPDQSYLGRYFKRHEGCHRRNIRVSIPCKIISYY